MVGAVRFYAVDMDDARPWQVAVHLFEYGVAVAHEMPDVEADGEALFDD